MENVWIIDKKINIYEIEKGFKRLCIVVDDDGYKIIKKIKTSYDIEYMNECMVRDLAVMLIEDYEISIPEALDILYNSETYEKLQDARTGLYFQSPIYVYDFLQHELKNGKIA